MSFARALGMGVVAGVAFFVAPSVSAQSLESELGGLMVDHPQIRAALKAVESTGLEINKIRAGLLPTVTATADIGPEIIDSPTQRDKGTQKNWTRTRQVATLTVTQSLFDGFAIASNSNTARLNKSISQITLEGTRQNVLFEGIAAYIDVLRQTRLIELARSNEETIQSQLELEDERVQRGSGIAVDVLQAKSRLQLAKERRVNFEGARQDAISRFTQVYDHAPDIQAMMDPIPPIVLVPSTLEEALDIAMGENPAVSNSDVTIEVARERRRLIKSEFMPTLDVVGKANFEKNKNATLGIRRDFSVLLQATWDLFTGLSTNASLSQAAYDLGASKDNRTYVSRKVLEQVKLSWQALLTLRYRLELLENAANIAAEVFDSRKKLREAGKETVINVLDAESEIFNAQINFAAASYDERVAIYQLLLAMGRLTSANLNLPDI